jgi:two-component system sensor histidine kinase PhoQ
MSGLAPRMIMPLRSLVGRFVFASLILLPLFISISATLLIKAFENSQIKAEQEKLQTHLYLLLSQTEVEKRQIVLPAVLAEPRFNQQNSGLYGFIFNPKGSELWRSPSAILLATSVFNKDDVFTTGERHFSQLQTNNKQIFNRLSTDIEWLDDTNHTSSLRFIILSDNMAVAAEIASYQKHLWQWLGLMSLLLIIVQMIIMRWGLEPLKHLSKQLDELQNNKIQRLDSDYPKEIQPVTESFNAILRFEQQQRERYRNTMSDLAHSLKTPLAVIQSQIDDKQAAPSTIHEQLERINQIISHQLKRAVIRVNQNTIGLPTDKISVATMANRLVKILSKVYQDKHIHFRTLIDDDIFFFGDEADLLEVMGNILDNACKYGNDAVTITANYQQQYLLICISDNGNGIPEILQKHLLLRGARGDTAQNGQGIGLSVAVDIISSYGGGLEVKNNKGEPHLRGACFCMSLPQNHH